MSTAIIKLNNQQSHNKRKHNNKTSQSNLKQLNHHKKTQQTKYELHLNKHKSPLKQLKQ